MLHAHHASRSHSNEQTYQAVELSTAAWLNITTQLLHTVFALVIQLRVCAVVLSNLRNATQRSRARYSTEQHSTKRCLLAVASKLQHVQQPAHSSGMLMQLTAGTTMARFRWAK